jgi:hypothetical protein
VKEEPDVKDQWADANEALVLHPELREEDDGS